MITVVDYGMGNLASVTNAIKRYTEDVRISSDPEDIGSSDKLVLPGVGAFKDAYSEIEKRKLREPIINFISSGKPFLGICLGLQLLFTKSYEDGEHMGFDVIKGEVIAFDKAAGLKVPHMGWNSINPNPSGNAKDCPLFKGVAPDTYMYFVHSYYVVPDDSNLATLQTDYGVNFCSMIWKDNIFAMQFHPEKSQGEGLNIVENFVRL